jgi:Plasmid pRiA4b ORF-3-like protein
MRGGANLEEPFERTIEVSDEMTLGTLHDTIQELTGFDNDHLFTFFMARGPRGQRTSMVETDQREEEKTVSTRSRCAKYSLWNRT